ncbi:MAG: ABC transporter substrate-binding protein [Lachnospiraceae bacterium]|nr:ABC transporter substrate-binding protein [Lachnospiraceae bacterium]
MHEGLIIKKLYRAALAALFMLLVLSAAWGCTNSGETSGRPDNGVGDNSVAEKPSESGQQDEVSLNAASANEAAAKKYDKVADSSDYTESEDIDDEGLTPIGADELNEGRYLIDTECSSSMFKIADSLLVVENGEMKVIIRIESDSYLFMYPGTAEEAASDNEENFIRFVNNDAGDQLYELPVEALDKALPFAAYSKKKEQWYNRTLLFKSVSLDEEAFKESRYKTVSDLKLEDGTYYIDVDLKGGSGKASIESPALLLIQDGYAAAMITWSSANYDYMKVEGDIKIESEIIDDRSTFIIPVKGFDNEIPVIADTTAMSKPYEIEYTLNFDSDTITVADPDSVAPSYSSMKRKEKIPVEYATGFTIDSFENNIYRINAGNDRYLLVPRFTELPSGIPENVTVIRTPVNRTYVASTSSMDFFKQLETLDKVGFASPEADKWTDSEVSGRIESGEIEYVGKYDAPEFETLLTGKADLAVENSMIYHSPDTKEKLEELSIPVFVDMTSYESDPRGRVEWIKVYGLLTGEYGKAVRFFDAACKQIDEVISGTEDNKPAADGKPSIAYFYISPKGHVGVRKPEDYITKMIEFAGGTYIPSNIKVPNADGMSSSVDMSMEDFYLKAKDADILIYNGTLYGVPESLDELTRETALLTEFKAVKEGRVYVAKDEMFQATCAAADVVSDLCRIVSGEKPESAYFEELK